MMDGELLAGFALALAAGACYDGGYALQALEARRAPAALALRPALFAHLLRRRLWVGATLLSLIGWPLQVLALGRAPITLVQPAIALGLIVLLVLGARLLHEPVGLREMAGAAIVIVAVGVCAWAAPDARGSVPRDPALALAITGLCLVALSPYAAQAARRGGADSVVLLIAAAGAADGLAAFTAKLIAEDAGVGHWGAAGAWVALVGAMILLGFLAETTALQRAPATRVAPAVLVLQVAIPLVLAPLIGGETWSQTPLGGAVLVIAIASLLGGVAVLAGPGPVASVFASGGAGKLEHG